MAELVMAMAILVIAMLPLAYSVNSDARLFRATYQRAVAMEIVDGEMEVLVAGEWHAFTPGSHPYPVKAGALTNLPPGEFILTIDTGKVRLEWRPAAKDQGGPVSREAVVQ